MYKALIMILGFIAIIAFEVVSIRQQLDEYTHQLQERADQNAKKIAELKIELENIFRSEDFKKRLKDLN